MRPTVITIEGFQGYQEPQTIDLTDLRQVVITGKKGSGKSSIPEAIGYALYGKTRDGVNTIDIIHTYANRATVELEFTHKGNTWRVTRTAPRPKTKGGQIKTKAYLDRFNPDTGQWETAGDARGLPTQTDHFIYELLDELPYEAFRATVFVEQDKAGTFATSKPSERYGILSAILNLEKFAKACEAARKSRTETAREREREDAAISTMLEQTQRIPDAQTAVEEATKEHTHAQEAVAKAEKTTLEANAVLNEALEAWNEASGANAEHEKKQAAAREKVFETERAHTAAAARVGEIERAISSAQNEAKLAQEAIAQEQRNLELNGTDRAEQMQTLASQQKQAQRKVTELSSVAATIEGLQSQRQNLDAEYAQISSARETVRGEESAVSTEIGTLSQQKEAAQSEYREARAYRASLAELLNEPHKMENGQCRECHQSLTPSIVTGTLIPAVESRLEHITRQGKELARRIDKLNERRQELAHQLALLNEQETELNTRTRDVDTRIATATEAHRSLSQAQESITELENALADFEVGKDVFTSRASGITARIEQAQTRVEQAARAEYEHTEQLSPAKEEVTSTQKAVIQAQSAVEELARTIPVDMAPLKEAGAQARTAHEEAMTAEKQTRAALAEADTRLAVATGELERLRAVEAETAKRQGVLNTLDEEIEVLGHAIEALDRNGAPQRVLNSAIADINTDLTKILGEITGGELSAELSTTKTTAKGTARNELNLLVTGLDGTRLYETFSGGQRYLVNIALHIALGKALSDRRGKVMDFFFMDEGTGALGTDDKAPLIRALVEQVAAQYSLLLAVAHDEDMVSALPERIHVEMENMASYAQVMS